MKELAANFEPTMILHHPHLTDSPRIWSTAWSDARRLLPQVHGAEHIWASGIAYCNGRGKCRGELSDVRCWTRCCNDHTVDVFVDPSN